MLHAIIQYIGWFCVVIFSVLHLTLHACQNNEQAIHYDTTDHAEEYFYGQFTEIDDDHEAPIDSEYCLYEDAHTYLHDRLQKIQQKRRTIDRHGTQEDSSEAYNTMQNELNILIKLALQHDKDKDLVAIYVDFYSKSCCQRMIEYCTLGCCNADNLYNVLAPRIRCLQTEKKAQLLLEYLQETRCDTQHKKND